MKAIQYLVRFYSSLLLFKTYRTNRPDTGANKVVLITIKKNPYGRYFYLFVKFFQLRGYVVYFGKSPMLFAALKSDQYAGLLLKEKEVRFSDPPPESDTLIIDGQKLSADYFSPQVESTYHVPMAQHPLMYHCQFWNVPVGQQPRKRSIFMAGNFDPVAYAKIDNDHLFSVLNRSYIRLLMEEENILYPIASRSDLQTFLESDEDQKIILVDRKKFNIPMHELRPLLARFEFYFALPGMAMPFSHNIIEAFSSGTIPFIQQSYADLFAPPLANYGQAVTFQGKDDLIQRLRDLFSISQPQIASLRSCVGKYYENYLTPKSVVENLEKNKYTSIYLQAERTSVDLMKQKADR